MPNSTHSNKTVNTYDAGDVADAYSAAESDLQWMSVAIGHVRKEIKRLHDLATDGEILSQHHLSGLINHLDMYEYLAEDRHAYHAQEAEKYSSEWEIVKGGAV